MNKTKNAAQARQCLGGEKAKISATIFFPNLSFRAGWRQAHYLWIPSLH